MAAPLDGQLDIRSVEPLSMHVVVGVPEVDAVIVLACCNILELVHFDVVG
jgi:hypothetical protein